MQMCDSTAPKEGNPENELKMTEKRREIKKWGSKQMKNNQDGVIAGHIPS